MKTTMKTMTDRPALAFVRQVVAEYFEPIRWVRSALARVLARWSRPR